MNREEKLNFIVEHDTIATIEDYKGSYRFIYDILMNGYTGYSTYTDKEIDIMYKEITQEEELANDNGGIK